MLDDFARRLKEIRSSKNMTMGEFGDLGDVSATTQGTYEREDPEDRRYPDVRYLFNLKSHGIDIHYLLTGEKAPDNTISPKSMALIQAYENADKDHKAIFEATAKACAVKTKGRVDKKKDDQDPPKSGTTNKMQIKAGGDVGDVMQDSVKNTTHNNYITNSSKNDHKLRFMYEDACEKINNQEKIAKGLTNLVIGFALLYGMGEMIALDLSPRNEIEQIIELILVTAFPLFFAYSVYRSATKKITTYFNNKRKRTEREIYLN